MTSSDSQILNLRSADPFGDASGGVIDDGNKGEVSLGGGLVHIRIQQRNGRKTLTTVQGISEEFDKKKLVRAFKKVQNAKLFFNIKVIFLNNSFLFKEFACNGTVVDHPEYGEVIQLQGDQRTNVCQFLTKIGIVKEEQLKLHGF